VKRGGLPLQQRLVVRMADDAVGSRHSFDRRVTCSAIILEKGMRLRKLSRFYRKLDRNPRALEVQD
jgi:hypothetical protein